VTVKIPRLFVAFPPRAMPSVGASIMTCAVFIDSHLNEFDNNVSSRVKLRVPLIVPIDPNLILSIKWFLNRSPERKINLDLAGSSKQYVRHVASNYKRDV
jgi:hypothetical protein